MKRSIQPTSRLHDNSLTRALPGWVCGLGLVLLVATIYVPALGNGFIWDDDFYIENNTALRSPGGLADIWLKPGSVPQYYPLVFSTFWVEYHLWGLDPRGYHLVNWLLHAGSAVLVWRLLVRLAVPGAWLGAALFAVHPVGVESVAWASERKNVLSCFLALGSILAYLRYWPPEAADRAISQTPNSLPRRHSGSRINYLMALVLFVAALWSKTVTASVPAVLLVIYWWKQGSLTWRDTARLAPFFAVGLVAGGFTVWMEKTHVGASGQEWEFTPVDRVLIAGRALWFYAGKLAWPHPLVFFYPQWTIDEQSFWQYLFPLAALAVLVGFWLARGQLGRGPLAAALIFAGVLFPALGFFDVFPFRYSLVADHFQYHASIALEALAAAAVAYVGARWLRVSWFVPLTGAAVLLVLVGMSEQRAHAYKNEQTLWEDTIARNPKAYAAYHKLGVFLNNRGQHAGAIVPIQRALELREETARSHPQLASYQVDLAEGYANLGLAQYKTGQTTAAETSFDKALEIRQRLIESCPGVSVHQNELAGGHVDKGAFQSEVGRTAEAINCFERAIEIREELVRHEPTRLEFQDALAWSYVRCGLALQKIGRSADACHRRVLSIRTTLARDNPTIDRYQDNLATSYVDLGLRQRDSGRMSDAEESFCKSIEIREKLVRDDPAISGYQDALAWSYVHRGLVQQSVGRLADAFVSHRHALAMRERLALDYPTRGNYRNTVAASHVDLGELERAMGRGGEAESSFRKAVSIREELVHEFPAVNEYRIALAASYEILALSQQNAGRGAEAENWRRKALEVKNTLARENRILEN